MVVKINELLRGIRHYFITGYVEGEWEIADGELRSENMPDSGLIGIAAPGPRGVHLLGDGGALPGCRDARWYGRIYELSPPPELLQLLDEINAWLAAQEHLAALALDHAENPQPQTQTVIQTTQPAPDDPPRITHQKESFGAYSSETSMENPVTTSTTTTMTAAAGSSANPCLDWAAAFRERLRPYRRMYAEVNL